MVSAVKGSMSSSAVAFHTLPAVAWADPKRGWPHDLEEVLLETVTDSCLLRKRKFFRHKIGWLLCQASQNKACDLIRHFHSMLKSNYFVCD